MTNRLTGKPQNGSSAEAPHVARLASGRSGQYIAAMTQNRRKAAGTAAIVMFIIAYALAMMALGGELAVGRGLVVELIFFALAGLLWLPVVMVIIRWMSRPDAG